MRKKIKNKLFSIALFKSDALKKSLNQSLEKGKLRKGKLSSSGPAGIAERGMVSRKLVPG